MRILFVTQKFPYPLDNGGNDGDGIHRGADVPTRTGCTHASLPFDSMTFARTYDSSPLNL